MNHSETICAEISQESCSYDTALVMAAKAGKKEAFAELIARHRRGILAVAHRITKNHADAEDVFQTTCLQAFLHVCRFDGRSKFSTWMTRIAINSALMVLRRNRASNVTSIDDFVEGDLHKLRDPRIDLWAEIMERERTGDVERAIGQLQPCLRTVMQVQRQHQSSIKQTAELAGLTVAATKSRLLRARRELRRRLQAYV